MRVDEVLRLALELPETELYDHGGRPAVRVRGKRFASMLDGEGINLMLGEQGIEAAVARWPHACTPNHFAGRLSSVRLAHGAVPAEIVAELLEEAWAVKAPKRLVEAYTGRG
jgi:hypothetical protein